MNIYKCTYINTHHITYIYMNKSINLLHSTLPPKKHILVATTQPIHHHHPHFFIPFPHWKTAPLWAIVPMQKHLPT